MKEITVTKNSDNQTPLVIVNPKSAGGATELNWARTASDLAKYFGAFAVEFTRRGGHAIEIAENAARGGRSFIIACGGDGTINEVVNGIVQSGANAELGILPSGTGGDFRRSLRIPNSGREIAEYLRDGATKIVDVGKVSFVNHAGEKASRYFLNVSSFGLSAAINERVKTGDALGWIPVGTLRGRAKFALSTLREVFESEPVTVRVGIDGAAEKSLNTTNFCVANGRYFGGGMKIAPGARIDDGLFDVVNIGDIGLGRILTSAHRLYSGSHLQMNEVKHRNARRVTVRAADDKQTIYIETDGELPGKLPASYEIVPLALRLRVPKS